jgi:phage shock protein A
MNQNMPPVRPSLDEQAKDIKTSGAITELEEQNGQLRTRCAGLRGELEFLHLKFKELQEKTQELAQRVQQAEASAASIDAEANDEA